MRETAGTASPGRKAAGEPQAGPRRRRWLRRLAAGVAGLLVVAVALYGWAWSSVDRSTVARALVWADADVGDQARFATPVDFARFGLLALHQGTWNGHRIVSKEWIRAATAADTSTDPARHYQYFWWVDTQRPGRFYALGNYGQYIYVAPDADAVVVRFGRDWGVDNRTWLATFRDVADRLARRS